ncbi:MAG: glycosyltransferase family 4 protein [Flavobacteriaceae bacterium]
MKKVLLITYYWPPAGGAGVQRWLKFTKYLVENNIAPIVYTVENPSYALEDTSFKTPKGVEVIKKSIWEPYAWASKISGKDQKKTSAGFLEEAPSKKNKMVNYIRANFFIPDARKYWVKPSVAYLENFIKSEKIETIITTGPPHSLHLIGLKLKQKLGIKWLADFRDPWTQIDYFHKLPFNKWALKKHYQLEKEVATNTDAVLVIGEKMKTYFSQFNKQTRVITNGFDGDDTILKVALDKDFTITHVGSLNADRNPNYFWESLQELITENADFKKHLKVKLIGKITSQVSESISRFRLQDFVEHIDYVPHEEVKKYQQAAQILLLPVNNVPSAKGILTGKIFEYLQANRPILALGPTDGDLAALLNKTEAGKIVAFDDTEVLKKILLSYFADYKKGNLKVTVKHLSDYQAKNITQELVKIIKRI